MEARGRPRASPCGPGHRCCGGEVAQLLHQSEHLLYRVAEAAAARVGRIVDEPCPVAAGGADQRARGGRIARAVPDLERLLGEAFGRDELIAGDVIAIEPGTIVRRSGGFASRTCWSSPMMAPNG